MQAQSAQWLNVRKDRPDWMIMWGWGAMNPTETKEAVQIRYPMDRFIGNWWSSAPVDLSPLGASAKGSLGSNFTAPGTDFPLTPDIMKHVIDNPDASTQTEKENVGHVLYNRAVINGVIVAEAIREAQKHFGVAGVNAEQVRWGLENIKLTEARLKELGLAGLAAPIIGSCADHEGGGSIFIHQWNGSDFDVVTDLIPPMTDVVRPMLEEAAVKYIEDKPDWQKQSCDG